MIVRQPKKNLKAVDNPEETQLLTPADKRALKAKAK